LNTVGCTPLMPMVAPLLIPQFSSTISLPQGTLLLPPLISLTPSPRASPSPCVMKRFPSLSNSLSRSNPLSQFLGDYHTVSDSKSPRKYEDASTSPLRSIVNENNIFRVIFGELSGEKQFAQIRVAPDGRIQLFSTIHKEYSFFLVNTPEPVPELLRWQNEYDHDHFVDWRRMSNRMKLLELGEQSSNSLSVSPARSTSLATSFHFDDILPPVDENPTLKEMNSFTRQNSRPKRPSLLSVDLPDLNGRAQSRSRERSPAPVTPVSRPRSKKALPLVSKRDSKQNLVTKVEPEVTHLIGEFFADEKDYRPNQKGRWGPPVLRGDNVLFVPAKKQAALENVTELIKAVKATCTIISASMVCQKKKKRQKKGFLVYLQLSSAEEVQAFLKGPYRHFASTVQGVKTAVFANDTN